MRQDSVLLALGSYPWICENVARTASTLWSRGSWRGEPWFPHCASVASWLTDFCMALCGLLFGFCFTLPYQSLRWYNVIISSCIFQLSMNWSADHRPCWFCFCFLFVVFAFWCFCLFCLVLGFLCLLFVLHGDSSMDYVSIQFSSLLSHMVIMTNVATALIRWICTMQLSFRLDKRPGESHLALDGKKEPIWNQMEPVCAWKSLEMDFRLFLWFVARLF